MTLLLGGLALAAAGLLAKPVTFAVLGVGLFCALWRRAGANGGLRDPSWRSTIADQTVEVESAVACAL